MYIVQALNTVLSFATNFLKKNTNFAFSLL